MANIRILATEDDPLHDEMLRVTVRKLGYTLIDVIFEPEKVLSYIAATKPDIILMDIDLGGAISGIDLAKKINESYDIPIIYVTSFTNNDTFKKAKETGPEAYVVKPYKSEELQRAIELAIYKKSDKKTAFSSWKHDVVINKFIYVKVEGSLKKVELETIRYVQAYDKYCFVYTAEDKLMIRSGIGDVIKQLPNTIFIQIHRSYIININCIDSINASKSTITIDNKEIAVGKTYKHKLMASVQTIG